MSESARKFIEQYGRVFAPSGSSRWLFCPGSVAVECTMRDKYPDRKDLPSIYASEGTVAHKVGALCITNDVSPYAYVGETVTADDETDYATKVTLEMAEAVNVYVEYVLSYIQQSFDPIYRIETKLDLTGISPYIGSGTSDAWVFQRAAGHLHVFDYKHGKYGYVEEKNNTQLMIYALGVTHELIKFHHIRERDITGVTIHIIQPRYPGMPRTRAWTCSYETLSWLHEFILTQIRTALAETPVFSPSESRCKWCPGKDVCIARAEDAMRSAQLDFGHLVLYEKAHNEELVSPIGNILSDIREPTFPAVELLSQFELAAILRWSNKIESFLTAVGEAALKLHRSGTRIPTFKLVRGRSIRAWRDEKEAVKAISALGIDKNEIYTEPKLKSPSQIETLLRSKKISSESLKDVVYKPEGNLKLAPVTDKRPEIDPKALARHDFIEFLPGDDGAIPVPQQPLEEE